MDAEPSASASSLPPNWWMHDNAARTLSHWFDKHLAGLHVIWEDANGPHQTLFSGFLLHYRGLYFWITAGHCIDQLRTMLADPAITERRFRWYDGCDTAGAKSLPVSLDTDQLAGLDRDGFDFGGIVLRPYYVSHFVANGKSFMTSAIWHNPENESPEGHYIIGYPLQWHEPVVRPVNGGVALKMRIKTVCAPLQRVEANAADNAPHTWEVNGAFYGRLLDIHDEHDELLEDVKGMSGGPVLSLGRTSEGKIKYRLVGIQSASLISQRLIRATPIKDAVAVLDYVFDSIPSPDEPSDPSL